RRVDLRDGDPQGPLHGFLDSSSITRIEALILPLLFDQRSAGPAVCRRRRLRRARSEKKRETQRGERRESSEPSPERFAGAQPTPFDPRAACQSGKRHPDSLPEQKKRGNRGEKREKNQERSDPRNSRRKRKISGQNLSD